MTEEQVTRTEERVRRPAPNVKDCFRFCVGKRVTGVLFDAMPESRADLRAGNKTLIFEDGTALTISNSGSYWIESKEDVARAIRSARQRLTAAQSDLAEVVALAESGLTLEDSP